MPKKKYKLSDFAVDARRLIDMLGTRIPYVGKDDKTYRVSFHDECLGLHVQFYLSTMTVVVQSPRRSTPVLVKKGASWKFFEYVAENLYKYV